MKIARYFADHAATISRSTSAGLRIVGKGRTTRGRGMSVAMSGRRSVTA
jgi:hypothetical protein